MKQQRKAGADAPAYKPGWSAEELARLPVALRISMMVGLKVCPQCRRYIDNRNHRRHVLACMRGARGGAS